MLVAVAAVFAGLGGGAARTRTAVAVSAAAAADEDHERHKKNGVACHTTSTRWPSCRFQRVRTTSKAEPGTRFSVRSCSFDQRGSGAPVMNQSVPLSETSIP